MTKLYVLRLQGMEYLNEVFDNLTDLANYLQEALSEDMVYMEAEAIIKNIEAREKEGFCDLINLYDIDNTIPTDGSCDYIVYRVNLNAKY